jgi:hypothetical protein
VFVQLRDRNLNEIHSAFHKGPVIDFGGFPNAGAPYILVVSADGYLQTGYTSLDMENAKPANIDMMLLPKASVFNFSRCVLVCPQDSAGLIGILSGGAKDIVAALGRQYLPKGTPLSYMKELNWQDGITESSLVAYVDQAIKNQFKQASTQGSLSPEASPAALHPGDTSSYERVQAGQVSYQLLWIAGRQAGVAEFEPLYTIESAK